MPNKIIKNYSELVNVDRYDVISNAITFVNNPKASGLYDNEVLTYLIKILLENGIVRISEEAYKNRKNLWKTKKTHQWQQDALDNMLKHCPQTDRYLQNAINRSIFTWEHVVPTKILVEKILEAWNKKKLNQHFVDDMIARYGFVCIVTKDENDRLNTYQSTMPNGWVYGKDDAFARYDAIGIKLM